MVTRKKEILRYVLNFTGRDFYTYASDGKVIMIPAQRPGIEVPNPDKDGLWSFVVDSELYEELKTRGRETRDLAFLSELQVGFGGLKMRSIFTYGENDRVMPLNCTSYA